jgi:hypothetical protein
MTIAHRCIEVEMCCEMPIPHLWQHTQKLPILSPNFFEPFGGRCYKSRVVVHLFRSFTD